MSAVVADPPAVPIGPSSGPVVRARALRRELERSAAPQPQRWSAARLRAQLPRVALADSLAILLEWRADPGRFRAGAVAWHARLAGHAPMLTLADAQEALAALADLCGPEWEEAAIRLRSLAQRHRLDDVAGVLDNWTAEQRSRRAS